MQSLCRCKGKAYKAATNGHETPKIDDDQEKKSRTTNGD